MRLGNRTYQAWGNIELPKYFLKLHQTAPSRSRKWLSDAYSLSSGAVPNRTYRVGAKRFQTAPTGPVEIGITDLNT